MTDDNTRAELTDDEEQPHDQMEGEEQHDDQDESEPVYDPGQKTPLDHGVKVRGKVKRGTDTRDQDELLIEGRGENAAEAAADFEAALKEAEEQRWADRLRALQPDLETLEAEDA